MSTYSPTLINQNKFQTISQKDSQPVVPAVKKPENGSMKSLITQAGYSGKVVAYHIPERENKDGPLLPPQREWDKGKKTLVLDLDETLVHSSFKPVYDADFIIPIEIDNIQSSVYVLVRPGTSEFLE